jgi:ribosome-associated protein
MKTPLAQPQTRIAPETHRLVQAAAAACEAKKGQETRILELDPVDSGLADYFLITSALNDRQAIAIADEIELRLKRDFGALAHSVEGRRLGEWILLDYVDFGVHVFLAERRAFYDIERLRKSARPLTPEEFDGELKAELTAKTRAARGAAVGGGVRSVRDEGRRTGQPANAGVKKRAIAGARKSPRREAKPKRSKR